MRGIRPLVVVLVVHLPERPALKVWGLMVIYSCAHPLAEQDRADNRSGLHILAGMAAHRFWVGAAHP